MLDNENQKKFTPMELFLPRITFPTKLLSYSMDVWSLACTLRTQDKMKSSNFCKVFRKRIVVKLATYNSPRNEIIFVLPD